MFQPVRHTLYGLNTCLSQHAPRHTVLTTADDVYLSRCEERVKYAAKTEFEDYVLVLFYKRLKWRVFKSPKRGAKAGKKSQNPLNPKKFVTPTQAAGLPGAVLQQEGYTLCGF